MDGKMDGWMDERLSLDHISQRSLHLISLGFLAGCLLLLLDYSSSFANNDCLVESYLGLHSWESSQETPDLTCAVQQQETVGWDDVELSSPRKEGGPTAIMQPKGPLK